MKKLFLALMLTGFVGAVSINTVSAFSHAKVVTCDCEKCKKEKKDKKCKDGSTCCKTKATTTTDNKCSKEGQKKCCSSSHTNTTPADSLKVK